jgi:hypothetical protein
VQRPRTQLTNSPLIRSSTRSIKSSGERCSASSLAVADLRYCEPFFGYLLIPR